MNWATPRSGQTVLTRRAAPSYQPWTPAPYQLRAAEHLATHAAAGLPLRPGGRKTSITLAAFLKVRETQPDATMLIVAPLRVCRQVWRQEGAKWEEFRHLKFSLLHGPKKDERLNDDSDIWLINPEGVEWLCQKYFGRSLPFYIVCIDELTKFKNSQADRSKALRPRLNRVPFRWGLTGSLAPNGYMDVFGQMLMLDDGAALGRYITHYRDTYFQLDYDGFTYKLMPGAEKRIVGRIAPYWFQMNEEDYKQLPPLVDVEHFLDLEGGPRKLYEKMKKDMIATLPEGIITAANSAACYSKLSQMANGAVYVGDNKQTVSVIHDLKLDAIEDLLEELAGEPLLVGYEFNHDLERLRDRFGVMDKATGKKVIPYLGKGTSAKQEAEWIAAWNRGELPLLCAHPASAGHGLNMQGSSAFNVAWFGITWDYELYDQFMRRIWRDGTEALRVFNHLLLVRGTIDELKLLALRGKDMSQSGLLKALNAEIRRNAETVTAPGDAASNRRNEPVVMKLTRPGAAAAPVAETTEAAAPAKVKGWGKKAAAEPDPAHEQKDDSVQRERIAEKLTGGAFSGAVGDKMAAIQAEHSGEETASAGPAEPTEKVRKGRSASAGDLAPAAVAPVVNVAGHTTNVPDTSSARLVAARVQLLTTLVPLFDNPEELTAAADELWAWAANPDALPAF